MLNEVYAVLSFDRHGRVTDVEFLDSIPQWDWVENEQVVVVGNINGGDSDLVSMPAENKGKEG
jgi:hypothetical protein